MVIILSLLLLILMQVTVSAAEPVAVAFEADTLKHSEITVSRVISSRTGQHMLFWMQTLSSRMTYIHYWIRFLTSGTTILQAR